MSLLRASLRLSGARTVSGRAYATATSRDYQVASASNGLRVAARDDGQNTAAISIALAAGSRYETTPGLSHVLKNLVFKSTNKRSALRLIRETELLGGILTSSLTRENLFLTAEFRRGNELFFAELLGEVLRESKFASHEYNEEVVPQVAAEYAQAIQSPFTLALDAAHQLAFREGLGNSLLANPHVKIPQSLAAQYAQSVFANTADTVVLGSGISANSLKDVVNELFASAPQSQSQNAVRKSSTAYHGGEQRLTGHGGLENGSFLLAFPGGAIDKPVYRVLRHVLGGESATKWNQGSSPLAKIESGKVQAFDLAYSDAGLFGFYVEAPTARVSEAAKSAVQALKKVAQGLEKEELARAIAKAKFEAALQDDSRIASLELAGAQNLGSGSVRTLSDTFSALDGVAASAVQQAAQHALKSKPTAVAVGDTHNLPYVDQLGL